MVATSYTGQKSHTQTVSRTKKRAKSKKRKGKATDCVAPESHSEETKSNVNELDLLFDTLRTNKRKKKELNVKESNEREVEYKRLKKEKEQLNEYIKTLESNST